MMNKMQFLLKSVSAFSPFIMPVLYNDYNENSFICLPISLPLHFFPLKLNYSREGKKRDDISYIHNTSSSKLNFYYYYSFSERIYNFYQLVLTVPQ